MPFPSAGCQTCKSRRIKCDETLPVCQRCIKSGRICRGLGAREAWSVVHIENPYASGQRKRPRGPRSTPRTELNVSQDAIVPRSLTMDLQSQAISYWFHQHVQTRKNFPTVSKSLIDEVVPIWTSKDDYPMLELAVSVKALALFSRTQHHPPAAIEASTKYHRLLLKLQETIPSLDHGNVDACLLAIFFMSRYEDAVHRPSHDNEGSPFLGTVQSFRHHDGALAILKIWKERLASSQPATGIIKHTRRGLMRSALMRKIVLPEWISDGSSFGEYGLQHEYDRIMIRMLNLRQRLFSLLAQDCTSELAQLDLHQTAQQLDDEIQDIDRALQHWAARFPDAWSPRSHLLPCPELWPSTDFYSPVVYSYSNIAYAAAWSQYYANRMLVASTRLRILELLPPSPNNFGYEQGLQCLANLTVMANDLASTLPFYLQRVLITDDTSSSSHPPSITLNKDVDIKPYMASGVIWPLSIACNLPHVDAELKAWFKSELAQLGKLSGIGVIECANNDQWIEF